MVAKTVRCFVGRKSVVASVCEDTWRVTWERLCPPTSLSDSRTALGWPLYQRSSALSVHLLCQVLAKCLARVFSFYLSRSYLRQVQFLFPLFWYATTDLEKLTEWCKVTQRWMGSAWNWPRFCLLRPWELAPPGLGQVWRQGPPPQGLKSGGPGHQAAVPAERSRGLLAGHRGRWPSSVPGQARSKGLLIKRAVKTGCSPERPQVPQALAPSTVPRRKDEHMKSQVFC